MSVQVILLVAFIPFVLCAIFESNRYFTYDEYTARLRSLTQQFPSKTYLYSIGKSVMGREMWVLALADSQPDKHISMRPEVKYVGNMHGNEVPNREVLFYFSEYLLESQSQISTIDQLLKTSRIHLLFSMNPDGFANSSVGDCYGLKGRANKNNYDLNRNFPDLFECNQDPIQPETQAVINWLEKNHFVLSANFHGGDLVVNYPYDNRPATSTGFGSITKDDDVFRAISLAYSLRHQTMATSTCGFDQFENGITNGAEWYLVKGGMQDFNYWKYGCAEVTIEIGCCKYPPASALNGIWLENKNSLVEYWKYANQGVRGVVRFQTGEVAKFVTIRIDDREPYFKTDENGEYYRILLPGSYTLILMFNCNEIKRIPIQVPSTSGLLEMNIVLETEFKSQYSQLSLNKYPIFCIKENQPVPCSSSTNSDEILNLNSSTRAYSCLLSLVLTIFLNFAL